MRRAAIALLVAGCVLAGAAASASTMHDEPSLRVSIGFADYTPAHADVLAGDTVVWHNDSVRKHTVTADDGSFDSGELVVGDGFTYTFQAVGSFPYHCTIHPFISGDVQVYEVLVDPPGAAAGAGRPFPLTGRSALPTGSPVRVEADMGNGFQPVAATTIGPGGHFTATVTPTATARYRAVVGDVASPTVQLFVFDRKVAVRASRRPRGYTVDATVTPASVGAPVVLQLRLRDRFGWWPVTRARLGRDSRVRFFVRLAHRVPARVVLTLPDGATPLAVSPTLTLGPKRRR